MKVGGDRLMQEWGVEEQFRSAASSLLGAAKAYNTLKVAKSAMLKVAFIEEKYGISLSLPWHGGTCANFVLACVEEGMAVSTIRTYLSLIKSQHLHEGWPWSADQLLANKLLKGRENLSEPGKKRIAITVEMLIFMHDKLKHDKGLSDRDKRMVWTLFCFLFSGSFRIGELLAHSEHQFVEQQAFLGKRLLVKRGLVRGKQESFLVVKLINPKERRSGMKFVEVELFDIKSPYNPVRAFNKLTEKTNFLLSPDLPVFRWSSGKNVTPRWVNTWLKENMKEFPNYPKDSPISSHSFRAGVVTMLGQMGAPEELIKQVGRWSSDAWINYCREGRVTRVEDQMKVAEMIRSAKGRFSTVAIVDEN